MCHEYGCFVFMICVHHMYAWDPQGPEADVTFPGIRVTDNCEWRCGCWELYPSPLEEQQVLLTENLPLQTQDTLFESTLFESIFHSGHHRIMLQRILEPQCVLSSSDLKGFLPVWSYVTRT